MTTNISVNEIKDILKNNENLSQSGLAKYLGVSSSLVSFWVNGKRSIPEDKFSGIEDYFKINEVFTKSVNVVNDVTKANKYDLIREDLIKQLERQNKKGNHYIDLVDHAIYFFKLKDELQADIETNGLRITMKTGNNNVKESDNASVRHLNQTSSQLLKILKDLGIDDPEVDDAYDVKDFM